ARAAESRYAAGRGSQADALKAQVELSKGLNLLLTAGREKETAAARLNALRNRPPGDPVPEPEEAEAETAPADHRALESAALAGNPYLKAMKARLEAYGSRLSLAKAGYAPDFMLGWRRRSADNAAMDGTWDVSLGLTIPLWAGRNRAETGEARAGRGMALAEYEAARNTLLLDLKAAAVRLDYYARLVELYGGSVLPQAEQALKASRAEYEAGQGSFLDLIDSGRTLVETRREYFEYRAGYSAWQARIKAMIGESL
ncbi:MAG TPA: TolC family protein, partial [Elusimicrobiales bacterium]|nr:TolC family protein [Elusimicrobiales bacterium]